MKTFYLFKLNKDYINIAKRTPDNIYILLNTIYRHNKKDILVAFDLFSEICLPINTQFFNEYIYNKFHNYEEYTKFKNVHMYNNYFTNEVSKMVINKSNILIKSTKNDNIFIMNLIEFENLFICDFKSDYYKYLTMKDKTKLIKTKQ